MFSRSAKLSGVLARNFSTTQKRNFKVCVVGGGGGIGQPLSLLLKLNPLVSQVNVYDLAPFTPGVAKDLSHIETAAQVQGFKGPDTLKDSLRGVDVVVIPAGVPRKPGMTRDDLFGSNANVVRDVALASVEVCPNAVVCIITNPVNSAVPIYCKIYEKEGKLDPRKIFGVSTLDVVRANAFVGEINKVNPKDVNVPVICGHSGITIIPVLSKATPAVKLPQDQIEKLTVRIQQAGTEVVEAKAGFGSATLSMGYAGARFVNSVIRGLKGDANVVECAVVKSDVAGCGFFANPLVLGKNGVEKNLGLPELNDYEKSLLAKAVPEMKKNVAEGEDFVNKSK